MGQGGLPAAMCVAESIDEACQVEAVCGSELARFVHAHIDVGCDQARVAFEVQQWQASD